MYTGKPPMVQRVGAGLVTALSIALVGWALLVSLAAASRGKLDDSLLAVIVMPLETPTPKPVVPERKPNKAPEGEAAPPNIRSTPTEVVAPKPPVVLIRPPIAAATVSADSVNATAGAAEAPGPGQGAGGIGNGRGSGGAGNGTGGGLGDEAPPRRIRGSLSFSDATRVASWDAVIGRAMTTRFVVGIDGRVSNCEVSQSSGLPALDAEICRLIVQRFRYRPSLDTAGNPIRAGVEMDHSWDQRF